MSLSLSAGYGANTAIASSYQIPHYRMENTEVFSKINSGNISSYITPERDQGKHRGQFSGETVLAIDLGDENTSAAIWIESSCECWSVQVDEKSTYLRACVGFDSGGIKSYAEYLMDERKLCGRSAPIDIPGNVLIGVERDIEGFISSELILCRKNTVYKDHDNTIKNILDAMSRAESPTPVSGDEVSASLRGAFLAYWIKLARKQYKSGVKANSSSARTSNGSSRKPRIHSITIALPGYYTDERKRVVKEAVLKSGILFSGTISRGLAAVSGIFQSFQNSGGYDKSSLLISSVLSVSRDLRKVVNREHKDGVPAADNTESILALVVLLNSSGDIDISLVNCNFENHNLQTEVENAVDLSVCGLCEGQYQEKEQPSITGTRLLSIVALAVSGADASDWGWESSSKSSAGQYSFSVPALHALLETVFRTAVLEEVIHSCSPEVSPMKSAFTQPLVSLHLHSDCGGAGEEVQGEVVRWLVERQCLPPHSSHVPASVISEGAALLTAAQMDSSQLYVQDEDGNWVTKQMVCYLGFA